jgi:predicted Zn-dependent protease
MYVLLMVTVALVGNPISSLGEQASELDQLRQKADSMLAQSNVSARREIGIVFELVDRLLEEDQSEEAEKYIVQGLKHFPWNLKYQMIHAELLAKGGKLEKANEKADLVLQYAEAQDLIERARKLLGKSPLPAFTQIRSLPGTDHRVVIVPLQECDKWLVLRIKKELSATLGIPVHIQTIATTYPPFNRDRRGATLNRIRRKIREDLDSAPIVSALRSLGLTEQELDDEANVLKLGRYLMCSSSPQAIAEFETYLEESKGKDPQWNADHLQGLLFRAVKPHRRENIAYLGITSVDIYAKDYNFLFGWANRQGGVMSYRRFTADFNSEVPNQDRLVKRTFMQCLSSIGHIYGIERCTNPTCARAYPNSLSEHDAKEGTLCSQCRNGFRKVFGQSPASDVLKAAPEE